MADSVRHNYQDSMIRSGDGQVASVHLYSSESSEPYDLTSIWENISIFENMTTPYIRGQITITDTQNLIQEAPIVLNERIEIRFKTASAFDFVKVVGHIVHIPSRVRANEGVQTYVLDFISAEFIRSKALKVRKAYHNTLISDMVSDIYDQYLFPANGKPLTILPTLERESKVVPNLSPHEAIRWLAKWARSPIYRLGTSYVFFENQFGYYFGPIEALIDSDKIPALAKYRIETVNAQQSFVRDGESAFETMSHYQVDSSNHLDLMDSGMYASRIVTHDPVLRTITQNRYSYSDQYDETTHLNPGNTRIHNDPRIGSIADANIMINGSHWNAFGDGVAASRTESTFLTRQAQMKSFDSNSLTITVPGDSERVVGEVVYISLPSIGRFTLPESQGEQDKYLSGRYLIHSLRHELVREDQNTLPKYSLRMRVVRDSVLEELPTQRVYDTKTIPV